MFSRSNIAEVYGDMPRTAANAYELDKLKTRLRFLDPALVRANLEDQIELGANDLLTSMQAGDVTGTINSILDYILRVNAKFIGLRTEAPDVLVGDSPRPVPWLNLARSELESFMAADPATRSILRKSVFFHEDTSRIIDLAYMASHRTIPGGDYDPQSYMAGVSIGLIKVRHLGQ